MVFLNKKISSIDFYRKVITVKVLVEYRGRLRWIVEKFINYVVRVRLFGI